MFAPIKFHDFDQVKVNMQTISVANKTGHQNWVTQKYKIKVCIKNYSGYHGQ